MIQWNPVAVMRERRSGRRRSGRARLVLLLPFGLVLTTAVLEEGSPVIETLRVSERGRDGSVAAGGWSAGGYGLAPFRRRGAAGRALVLARRGAPVPSPREDLPLLGPMFRPAGW